MRRALGYAAVLAVGLMAGFGLRAGLEPAREDRMAELLEDVCLPYLRDGERPAAEDLLHVGMEGDGQFVHEASMALVQLRIPLQRRSCSVSDTLDPLQGAARERFLAAGAGFAARHLPKMPLRDLTENVGWTLFHHYGVKNDNAPGKLNLLIFDFGEAGTVPGVTMEVVRFLPDDGAEA